MKTKALSRDDRKRQILLAFAAHIQTFGQSEMTTADIGRAMHQTASTKLRDMIMELVIEGQLTYRDEPIPGVCKYRRVFIASPDHFKRPKAGYRGDSERAIKINTRQGSFLELLKS